MFADEELIQLHKQRAAQIRNIILVCFIIIGARLFYLQIVKGEEFHRYSLQNRLRKEVDVAPRGMIFSRNSVLLVDNKPRFDATLVRQFLQDNDKTLARLGAILDMEVDAIEKIIKRSSNEAKYRPITIKKDLTLEEVAKIETENAFLPGISVTSFISREYTDREVGAHLLGYVSEISSEQLPRYRKRDNIDYKQGDFIGQFGIEEVMDRSLRGENGFEFVEVDALGRKKTYINTDNLFKGIENQASTPGDNLELTIDRDMQLAGYEALGDRSGSVVALDVNSGEILAMVSTPSFDPSQFSRGLTSEYWSSLVNNKENPLRDRNIQEHFSPGSTFKPFAAIAALEENLIDHETKIRCHGTFTLGRRTYHSWKKYGTETVDITDALKNSCNIFFYKIASQMDIDVMAKYASMFGFGHKTGISLPREVAGLFPTKEWKKNRFGVDWQQGETLSCAIGQSYVLSTVLQLANAYSMIANRGKMYRPYVVKNIFSPSGEVQKAYSSELVNEITLKDSTWDLIQDGLRKVANEPGGTAFWRKGFGNHMAGKTGTSQVVRAQSTEALYSKCEDAPYELRHHALFVAYAPYDNPKISVAAFVEHGCGGASAAAPIVEKVINTYMKKYLPDDFEKYKKEEWAFYRKYISDREKASKKQQESEEE